MRELAGELNWDVAGKDIRALGGRTIMAAVGAGLFSTYSDAVARIVKLSHRIEPTPDGVREYQTVYETSQRLRKAGNLFHNIK